MSVSVSTGVPTSKGGLLDSPHGSSLRNGAIFLLLRFNRDPEREAIAIRMTDI